MIVDVRLTSLRIDEIANVHGCGVFERRLPLELSAALLQPTQNPLSIRVRSNELSGGWHYANYFSSPGARVSPSLPTSL
jgi:hypothetical protein